MADEPPLHADLSELEFLLGHWVGEGAGHYPTIDDFSYREQVWFEHVGKPFISYRQATRDAVTGLPLHAETGYLSGVTPQRHRRTPRGTHRGTQLASAIDERAHDRHGEGRHRGDSFDRRERWLIDLRPVDGRGRPAPAASLARNAASSVIRLATPHRTVPK